MGKLKELVVTVEGAQKGRSTLTGAMDVHFKGGLMGHSAVNLLGQQSNGYIL